MCDLCHASEPSVHVAMSHNVGMLVLRHVQTTEARMCSRCLVRTFAKHQLLNLTVGWWGTISFFATFYFLFENTTRFVAARRELAGVVARRLPVAPVSTVPPRERLEPFRHNVRLRRRGGERPDAIAADLARTHDVTLAEATAFVEEVGEVAATTGR